MTMGGFADISKDLKEIILDYLGGPSPSGLNSNLPML